MEREIKFRFWDKKMKCMVYDTSFLSEIGALNIRISKMQKHYELMQFTGLKDKNGKDIYEGDVVQTTDEAKLICIVTWIKEWCMFGSLIEYEWDYWQEGIKELDEYSFWTYPMEKSEDYEIIGNIYENPELIK